MFIRKATAPSPAVVRPRRTAVRTAGFPVYDKLTDKLIQATRPSGGVTPSPEDFEIAHVMATCSGYAYGDAATVSMIMARMGLEDNHCLEIAEDVGAMLIRSSAFLVQSADRRVVILCYRGTPPADFVTALTSLDTTPDQIRWSFPGDTQDYTVHAGYYRNVRATRFKVIEALGLALAGRSVLEVTDDGTTGDRIGGTDGSPAQVGDGLEALYLTGHSLGGVMAALMGIMLKTETDPQRTPITAKLYPIHTFGQPKLGPRAFARACDATAWNASGATYGQNLIRWVNQDDPIPQFPPALLGEFAHSGREYRYGGETTGWTAQPGARSGSWLGLPQSPLSVLTSLTGWARQRGELLDLADHAPARYLNRLTPDGVVSEFGD